MSNARNAEPPNQSPTIAVLASTADDPDQWRQELAKHALPIELYLPDEDFDPAHARYAIIAKPPPGLLNRYPNLRAALSLWAGMDHLGDHSTLPPIPLYRMLEPGLTQAMGEFVLSQVLNLHLGNYAVLQNQRATNWQPEIQGPASIEPLTHQRTVGILGLGELGAHCATTLAQTGFRVSGWSRTARQMDGVTCVHGAEGLSQILVNLLPLTDQTRDLLGRETLARMRAGASLINVGRGEHVVDAELLAALDSGHLSHAVLDVFRQEPLPTAHPFWKHPLVSVFPHRAATTRLTTGAAAIAHSLRQLEVGEEPAGRYDPTAGY